jgi:hypothetical protein
MSKFSLPFRTITKSDGQKGLPSLRRRRRQGAVPGGLTHVPKGNPGVFCPKGRHGKEKVLQGQPALQELPEAQEK